MNIREHLIRNLSDRDIAIFFSGSSARKLLMQEKTASYNVFTNADLVDLAKVFENIEFPGLPEFDARLLLDNTLIKFKCFNISYNSITLEFLRKISESQLITVDTFFFDLKKDIFYDPLSAYFDLRNKTILPLPDFTPGHTYENYKILEILELVCCHEFKIQERFIKDLSNLKFDLDVRGFEMIKRELNEVLTSENPYTGVIMLDRLNILDKIFPALKDAKKIHQDKEHHPEGNVYEHTIECFKYLKNPSIHLSLAILLHDIGKPETACDDSNNPFPEHSRVGARMARKILRNMGYDETTVDNTVFLIENHLLSHILHNLSEKKRTEFMKKPLFHDLLKLYKADIQSCFGDLSTYYRIASEFRKHKPKSYN